MRDSMGPRPIPSNTPKRPQSGAVRPRNHAEVESNPARRNIAANASRSEVEPDPASVPLADVFGGAMPKQEIGALDLLSKNPAYDGRYVNGPNLPPPARPNPIPTLTYPTSPAPARLPPPSPAFPRSGVVIAIFDSGVDPAAAGLATTTLGYPKVLDVIDCTGSGDVDTSTIVEADASGVIQGKSGRPLRVNKDWVNPSGKWHVGCVRAYNLYTSTLRYVVPASHPHSQTDQRTDKRDEGTRDNATCHRT